jgi:hypothetical protein
MRVGFFGGIILLMLTIVFSVIAVENNKIAKTIVIKEFGLENNETNISKKDKFNTQFKKELSDFDKKFNSF